MEYDIGNIYDHTERQIGLFFGEPLYMKSFKTVAPSKEGLQVVLNISDLQVKEIIGIEGVYRIASNSYWSEISNYPASSSGVNSIGITQYTLSVVCNTTTIRAHAGTSVYGQPVYLTLKYTKI